MFKQEISRRPNDLIIGMKTHNIVFLFLFNFMFLKGGPSDLGRKFYKNTEKSSLYSQSLLIFIPVVENHPTTGEIRELLRSRSTPTRITACFYMNSSLIYIMEKHRRKFQTQRLILWEIIICLLCYGI